MAKLTAKQQMFVKEYLIDLNATQAAIRAGYSPKTANRTASENMTKPDIQAAIQAAQQKRATKVELQADDVLRYLDDVLHTSTTDIVRVVTRTRITENGPEEYQDVEIRDTAELTDAQKAAIASIKQTKDGIEVKLHDKTKIAELAMRHLGMFVERIEHSGGIHTTDLTNLTPEERRARINELVSRRGNGASNPS